MMNRCSDTNKFKNLAFREKRDVAGVKCFYRLKVQLAIRKDFMVYFAPSGGLV